MGQPVAYFEINSPDHKRAQDFYAQMFDWNVTAVPEMGGYSLVDTGAGEDAIGGGIGPSDSPADAGVKIYMRVDDLSAYLERAERLGGKTVMSPITLPGDAGQIAIFTDPDGNAVGLWS
jgi:predicted enzyme related to lactoylglutathione lyase